MNHKRSPSLAKLFDQLKGFIQVDSNSRVNRRNLRHAAEGDVQLELDFGSRSIRAQNSDHPPTHSAGPLLR